MHAVPPWMYSIRNGGRFHREGIDWAEKPEALFKRKIKNHEEMKGSRAYPRRLIDKLSKR